ncbi:Uncharacterized protein GBIM_09017 [Gryllus bimaculatus]|nr:Uncharacterized protein GBIM_09017 [Gryllus bimaculatus]
MSVTTPSGPREIQDFQFKLICRLHVFDQKDGEYQGSYNLVATASKFGLLFVGSGKHLQAILLHRVLEMENPTDHKSPRGASHGGNEVRNYPRRELLLPDPITNLQVNCDQSLLAIAVTKGGCSHALIYDVTSFYGKTINLVKEVRLSTSPDAHLLELSWNPGIANVLACCHSNGTLGVYEFKNGGVDINTLPPEAQATCFSWSPKGKQLVVGSLNGSLTQYKPDLKAVKNIPPPTIFENLASVVNVLWISNYQFAAVYRDSINELERPSLIIVNAPKTGGFTFVNYEDICYSSGELRKPQFYLLHQPNWNVLVVGSANSMEVGVLGLTADQLTWEQWLQEDASRAELPLTASKEETFPLGIGLDTSTQKQLPWGENQFLPPMPVLTLLSHRGVLCLFYVINTLPNAPVVCTPPEKLPEESLLVHFVTTAVNNEQNSTFQEPVSSQQDISTPQPTKPAEWSTPSGVVDVNRMGLRVNLAERFENISPQHQGVVKSFSFAPNEPPKIPVDSSTSDLSASLKVNAKPASIPGTGSLFPGLGTQQPFSISKSNENSSATSTVATPQGNTTFNFTVPAATSTPNLHGVKLPQTQQLNQPALSQKQDSTTLSVQQLPQQQIVRPPFYPSSSQQQQLPPSQQSPQLAQMLLLPQHLQLPQQSQPQPLQQTLSQGQQLIQQRPALQKHIQQTENSLSASKPLTNLFGNLGDIKALSNVDNSQTGKAETKIVSAPASATTPAPSTATATATGDGSGDSEGAKQTIINSEVLYLAIQEEMNHFESEMAELKANLAKLSVEVGTPDEKTQLRMKVDAMNNFCQELQEATNALCSEVRALKAEMVESLAWAEDARSRAVQQNDPCWLQVVRSQELDPVSARYLGNVKQLSYYVETQLCQADRSLELQWANFQESCRDKIKGRLYIPSLEAVYQAMVLQSNILLKQKANVKRIMERTAKHKMTKGDSLSVLKTSIASVQSKSDTDLAVLAENLLQMRLEASGATGVGEDISDIMAAGRYSIVASVNRKLTPEKQTILREFLTQGPVRHIRPVKPSSNALKNLALVDKDFKSSESKPLKCVSETSPLGHLDKMVARMGSENVNGLKTSLLSSVPQRNTGVSPKENQRTISIDRQNPGDLFGHIAKSVVTKFKEPDSSPSDSIQIISANEETTKNLENQQSHSDNSIMVFNSPAANKQAFSSSSSLPPSSGAPLSKSKPMPNFSFSLSNPSASQLGEGFSKNNSASNFNFQVPSTSIVTSTVTGSVSTDQSIFGGISNKLSTFSFFPSSTTSTTSAPVKFFGNSESSAKEPAIGTTPKAFSFGSLSVSNTPTPTSGSPQVFSDKTISVHINASTSATSLTAKATQAPSILGNSGADFSFSAPSTAVSSQSASNTVKSIFGEVQSKAVSETAIPDSSSQSVTNKSSMPTLNLFGSGSSLTITSVNPSANTQASTKPASIFSSGLKNTQGTGDFSLGQLDAALSLPSSNKDDAEKLEQTISTSAPKNASSTSTVTSSVSTKSFSFTLPTVSTSSATFVGTKSPDENEKNKSQTTTAPVSFFGQPVCSPSSFNQSATNIFGQKTTSSIFGGGTNSVVSSSNEDKTAVAATATITSVSSSTTTATITSSTNVEPIVTTASLDNAAASAAETTTAEATSASLPNNSISLFSGSALVSSLPSSDATETTSNPTTSVVTTSNTPSLFGNSAASTPSFGNTSTSSSSVFGGATTASSPVFGSATNFFGQTSTTSSSIFKPQGIATITSGFGQAATATTTTTTTTTSTATTTGSIFGQATTSTTSIFGQAAAAAATTSSIFGQPSTSTTTVFGQPPASTTASVFGQQPSSTSSSSIFGQPTTSTGSVFGQPAATTATSLFGQTASTAASVFGQSAAAPSAAATTTSAFGSGSSASSIFGQPASTASTNVFGQPSTTPSSAFGGSSTVFGQTTGTFMGGGTQPAFGANATFGQSGGSLFGQSSGTNFATSGGSIFGGSNFGKTGNLFQPTTGGSIFGGGSSSAGTTGGAFSAPQGQSIAESGFGSPTSFGQQNKPGGFGSPPAFGQASGGSGFGSSPTFGGAPTFGGSPIFGSPNRVFGSPASPSGGGMFGGGNTPQQPTTFENLANQNTMTFGNLASGQSPTFGSSGGSLFGGAGTSQPQAPAFQNTPSFGGSSFSSWR